MAIDRTVVATEANRGIGQSLVEEVLSGGVRRGHAARRSQSLADCRRNGAAHALEHQNGMFVQAAPVMS
jgi:NAD(P)-dependent dehydrogenase (short-subunit alcohol dehydrogenase family)